MNTIENLPVFTVVYIAALWTNADAPNLTLAWVCLGARVVQSLIHISSRAAPAIRMRALMQLTQMVCFLWLGGAAIRAALAA